MEHCKNIELIQDMKQDIYSKDGIRDKVSSQETKLAVLNIKIYGLYIVGIANISLMIKVIFMLDKLK